MNLVFTSAGDNTNFDELWFSGENDYDVIVIYYGDDESNYQKYSKIATRAIKRKGSKFQNFHHFFHLGLFDAYEYFFILDDDIEISTSQINKMFEIAHDHELKICAPAFTHNSKVSFEHTYSRLGSLLRYTNFVELNTPLFNRQALMTFMKYYDGSLVGWGIDFLYIWANGIEKKSSYAIVDCIECRNPHDKEKPSRKRELSKITNWEKRQNDWNKYRDNLGIKEWQKTTHSTLFEFKRMDILLRRLKKILHNFVK